MKFTENELSVMFNLLRSRETELKKIMEEYKGNEGMQTMGESSLSYIVSAKEKINREWTIRQLEGFGFQRNQLEELTDDILSDMLETEFNNSPTY